MCSGTDASSVGMVRTCDLIAEGYEQTAARTSHRYLHWISKLRYPEIFIFSVRNSKVLCFVMKSRSKHYDNNCLKVGRMCGKRTEIVSPYPSQKPCPKVLETCCFLSHCYTPNINVVRFVSVRFKYRAIRLQIILIALDDFHVILPLT